MSEKFKSGRTRSSNFTKEDQLLLLEGMKNYRAIIEPKKTDSVKQADKQLAWVKITEYFNSNTLCQTRNTENLISCYRNMKSKMKKQHSEAIMLPVGVGPDSIVSNDSDFFLSSYHVPLLGKGQHHSDLHEVKIKIEPHVEGYDSDADRENDHGQPKENNTIDNSQKPLEENKESRTDVLQKNEDPALSHNGNKQKTSFINSFKELSKAKLELVKLQKVVLENEYKHKQKLQEIELKEIIEENKFKQIMRKKELELIQIKINNAKSNIEP